MTQTRLFPPDRCRKFISGSRLRIGWVRLGLWLTLVLGAPAIASDPLDVPVPGDDAIYRPTLVVRKGPALGTGVIIASVEGETLILTAAHVVEDPGPLYVEVFRYNLGWERNPSKAGFPRRLKATVAALDRAADLAILRVGGQLAFPYVARIAETNPPIATGTAVTSIGFDRGERLIGFPTQVQQFDQVEMQQGAGERPFLITRNPPVVGRSGGGLFRQDGVLVGICLARARLPGEPVRGLYSPVSNIHRLLTSNQSLTRLVARSHPVVPPSRVPQPTSRRTPPEINRTGDRLRAN